MTLVSVECYDLEEAFQIVAGCFDDINVIPLCVRKGYTHDVSMRVEVRTSTQKDINDGYTGTSKESFISDFRSTLNSVSFSWDIHENFGYHR